MLVRLISGALLLFSTACVNGMADQTISTRQQSFPAAGVTDARLETGAGSLTIVGRPGAATIEVTAEYKARASSQQDVQRILDNLKLTMELRGSQFFLKTEQLNHWNWSGDSGSIDLTITMPPAVALSVDDGSGSIEISGIQRDISIDDGSGSIEIREIQGSLTIDDGSGSIHAVDVTGNIDIKDGSGEVDVRNVRGSVRVSDGSGSIDVESVTGDLIVASDGSGSIRYRDIQGNVDIPRRKR
jgi:DUF4097 and DUF4098 domain-containing protein YvlB